MEEKMEDMKKEDKSIVDRKKSRLYLIIELYTWVIFGILFSFLFWGSDSSDVALIDRFVYVGFVILFIVVFKLIFSKLPVAYFRDKFIRKDLSPNVIVNAMSDSEFKLNIKMLLAHNIQESKANAERLLSQSRVYLFWGCMIAIAGVVVFFYSSNNSIVNTFFKDILSKNDSISIIGVKILEYLPRFGVLFFIEYIAFFFLKQYRILMEEYRYYEAIKRERQDLLSVYLLVKVCGNDHGVLNMIIDYMDKHSAKVPMITGSHKIKTEKIINEDMDILSKVTTLIQTIKPTEKNKD